MQSEVKERLIYELSNGICRFPAAVDLNITFIDSHQEKKTGKVLDVITGTKGTWTFHVENFHGDFGPETRFIPLATNYHFAHKCQTQKPKGRDYTTIQACTDAKLQIGPGSRYGFTCPFYIEVEEGVFKKGDSFTVTVGDRSCGSKGSETYWTVTEGTVYLFIEKEDRIETSDYPPVKIFGKPHPEVRYIRTILPTVAAPKEEFDVTVGVYDRNSNIIEDFSGTVILEGTDGFQGLKDRLFFTKADRGTVKIKGISCREEGVKRITARLEEGRQGYLSNPLKVMKNPPYRIYWGDLHAHGRGDRSMYIMSANTEKMNPRNRHYQAHEQCALDFCAVGPMSLPRINAQEIWDEYKAACRDYDKENRYVPFLCYESHPEQREGDRQIIFKSLDEPLPPPYETPLKEVEGVYGKRDDVIMEVHIGGSTPKWDTYDCSMDRMVEVISGFGNAEWLMQKALGLGKKFSVCGCTDLHAGLLGGPRAVEPGRGRNGKILYQRDSAYGSGPLTASLSSILSREQIWASFLEGRTYAVSGARIYVDFAWNGRRFGETVPVENENRFRLCCHGADILERIDIICGARVVRSYRPEKLDFETEDVISSSSLFGEWIYVRVRQKDEHYAITTPIRFETGMEKWNEGVCRFDPDTKEQAAKYLPDLMEYLEHNEDINKWKDIKPLATVKQENSVCALFTGKYENTPVTLRWFYEFEMPK
ncbi:MAG: hypothetical protein GX082_15470, partial [Clostridiaceae bacterium]|nr:hypothetical protein [Clostridiaceae bacterium]